MEKRRYLAGEAAQPEAPVPSSAAFDGTELAAKRNRPGSVDATDFIGPLQLASVAGGTAATGRQPTGALTGKVVFTVGGHGFTAYSGGWHTQRGETNEMVEDLGNQDQMTMYVNYLFNAGATVVPLRPVGYQPNEVVLDNDSAGVTYTGTWSNSTSSIFYGSAGDVPYRYAAVSASQTATAKYTPTISVAGFYPVYTWVKDDTDRINQIYRVSSAGGIAEVRVDHRRVGKGYVYLGTYYFNAGSSGYVEISNAGTNTGSSIVVADTIRFGNGMGSIDRGLGTSGQTRSDESAIYWIEEQRGQGVDDSVFRGTVDTDDNDNVGAPPRWAAWMNREVAGTNNEIFLSFHSNASGGAATSRGTEGLYNGNNDPATKTPNQFAWAQLVGKEVNDDLVALGGSLESTWFNRANPTLDRSDIEFGEINNLVIGDEFDATIVEVAYHDNVTDAALMRDPKVRDYVARASLQATIKYFNQINGESLVLPPDSPTNVRAIGQSNGDVVLSWDAPVVNAIGGAAPTGFLIELSSNGYGFGNGIAVAGGGTLTYTIPAALLGGATYFRVIATNVGGDSMPTEMVAARGLAGGKVLIVNGFDRVARTLDPVQTTPLSYAPPYEYATGSTFSRVRPRFSNSGDYAAQAAEAIKANSSVAFDTTSNESLIAGQVNLTGYAAVIWLSGEESTVDRTFDATEQTLVTNYLAAGGKLFVSGSEIGWDLDASSNGASFYNNQLKADYVSDDAGTYTATGAASSIFSGINVQFDDGTFDTYDAEFPDKLLAFGGSTIAMNYSGAGSGGAAVQYSSGNTRLVNMGFPFETITSVNTRNAVMGAVLNYFGLLTPAATGAIAGRVFRDSDADLTPDGAEQSLNGRTVYLDSNNNSALDAGEPNTITAGDGEYSFSGLAPATYRVRVVSQAGWINAIPFNPALDQTLMATVLAGQTATEKNIPLFLTAFVGSSNKDQYVLRNLSGDTTKLQILESLNGGPLFPHTMIKTQFTSLTFDAQGGNDRFEIKQASSAPLPTTGTVSFTGGSGTADMLVITGSSSNDTVSITGNTLNAGGPSVTLSGVEQATVNGNSGNDLLQLNAPTPATVFTGGASTTSDTLQIVGGTYAMNYDGRGANGETPNLAVTVNSGAAITFGATQHLASLAVTGTATLSAGGAKVIVTRSVSTPSGGKINLTDNDMIVDYTGSSPYVAVEALVTTGRNGGAWTGAGIGTTTPAGSFLTGLGIAEAAEVMAIAPGGTALFAGETVDATSILIKYTYTGDANLSGLINADDYAWIDVYSPIAGAKEYAHGDFNYDDAINADDYALIDFAVMQPGGQL